MKVKLYLLLLMLFGVAFAVDANLTNSSLQLNYGQCVNVTDGTNFLYVCGQNFSTININKTLTFGEVYNNSTFNISVTAPSFPKIDLVRNLNFSQSYTNSTYNITVNAPSFPMINVTRILNYSEIFSMLEYNLVLVAPANPGSQTCNNTQLNVSRNLDFGGTFNNSAVNISLSCPNFPALNIRRTLQPGESMTSYSTDDRYNYSILCNQSAISDANLQASLIECNTQVISLSSTVATLNASAITFAAKEESLNTKIADLQKNVTTPVSSLDTALKAINCTSPAQLFCPDSLQPYCTGDEKASGNYPGCINRVFNNSQQTLSTCQNTLASTQISEQQCKDGRNANQELMYTLLEVMMGIGIVAAVVWGLSDEAKKRRIEEDGG